MARLREGSAHRVGDWRSSFSASGKLPAAMTSGGVGDCLRRLLAARQ
jgi:hypothetical protein